MIHIRYAQPSRGAVANTSASTASPLPAVTPRHDNEKEVRRCRTPWKAGQRPDRQVVLVCSPPNGACTSPLYTTLADITRLTAQPGRQVKYALYSPSCHFGQYLDRAMFRARYHFACCLLLLYSAPDAGMAEFGSSAFDALTSQHVRSVRECAAQGTVAGDVGFGYLTVAQLFTGC